MTQTQVGYMQAQAALKQANVAQQNAYINERNAITNEKMAAIEAKKQDRSFFSSLGEGLLEGGLLALKLFGGF